MQKKNGISLIVLVITIIVMVILAGAIILTLNNSGIIGKASDAVEQTNISTIKEVVQMAWAEAYANGERTEEGLKAAVDNALVQNKITSDMYKGYKIEVTTSGVELLVDHNGAIIPKGATYITNATVIAHPIYGSEVYDFSEAITYNAGDEFPELKNGDQYIYGDFTYVYNAERGVNVPPGCEEYAVDLAANGWYVSYTSSNPNVGVILEKINNSNVTSMKYTFQVEKGLYLETLTNIPSTIKDMEGAFSACENLKSVPDIPEGVVNMGLAFSGSRLETAPVIPSTVTNIDGTFYMCSSLEGVVTINSNPTYYENCFYRVDMSKITLAGKCSRELKQLMASVGDNADQVTIID